MLIKGTRAVQLIKGIVVLLVASNVSDLLKLTTIQWILDKTWGTIFVALAVIFQPELRKALEQLGRGKFFSPTTVPTMGTEEVNKLVSEISIAISHMAKAKIGALIVFERETGLNDYIETGIKIDGIVSSEFLENTFVPQTPLHDGAMIIRGDRALAAGCFLPLTDNPNLQKSLGTRHRAALGITEISDALAVVISEETGIVSIAHDGALTRYLNEEKLTEQLRRHLAPAPLIKRNFLKWRSIYEK
jgi:diadenylate cyclase